MPCSAVDRSDISRIVVLRDQLPFNNNQVYDVPQYAENKKQTLRSEYYVVVHWFDTSRSDGTHSHDRSLVDLKHLDILR